MLVKAFSIFLSISFLSVPYLHAESNFDDYSKLAESREWQVALQYWRNLFGETTSRIDDESFFFSPDGKSDPDKEMKAYFEAVLKGENLDEVICKHPARYRTLNNLLRLEERKLLAPPNCERLNAWKKSLGGKSASLIFPSAYLNNPASMYGHTFLRFNSNEGSKDALLAYGASYGATTGADGGVTFAFKGLMGGYRATFSLEPYYDLTKKYGDIEHRDIWEYELNLNLEEIDRALDFIWEVGNSYADYYFFDENCSLYVLAVLEYARPSLHLIEKFNLYVIPTDTLRALTREQDLVGEISFRPSLISRLEDQSKDLETNELRLAKNISQGEKEIPEGKLNPKLMEFSFDYLEYLSSEEKITPAEARKLTIDILKKRSELEALEPKLEELNNDRPDLAHASGRFILGVGTRGDNFFSEYHIHPSYHDALDPRTGLVRGQSIQFFDLKLRHYENDNLELTSFYPVSIESFSPIGKVFSPISWEFKVGADRQMVPKLDFKNEEGSLIGVMQGGAGKTFGGKDHSLSALLDVRATTSPAYQDEKFSLGAGPVLKLSYALSEDLRALVSGSLVRMELGQEHWVGDVNVGMQYDLGEGYGVRGNYLHQESFDREFNEVMLGGVWYF